jgi:hypothetical protein
MEAFRACAGIIMCVVNAIKEKTDVKFRDKCQVCRW